MLEKTAFLAIPKDSQLSFTKHCSLNSYFLKFSIFLQIILAVWKVPRYYKTLDARLAVKRAIRVVFERLY
jgi:hypothetical protein